MAAEPTRAASPRGGTFVREPPREGQSADGRAAPTLRAVDAVAALERRAAEFARLREVLLMTLAVMLPLSVGNVIWSVAGGQDDFNRRVSISPFDLPLAALLVVAIVDRRSALHPFRWTWPARIAAALAVVLAAAFVAHPSPRGVDLAFRLAAGLAVIDALGRLQSEARRHVTAVIAGIGVLEAVIAFAESAKGEAVGLGPLEFSGFFYKFGSSTAAHAGFDHPYHLACFLLVALAACLIGATRNERPEPWLAAGAVVAAGLATTYSRTLLLTLVTMLGILVLRRGAAVVRRRRRQFAAVVTCGFLIAAVAFGNGWVTRGQNTSTGQNIDSDRTEYARDAFRLTRDHPVLGVGPGRYTIALESVSHKTLLPAHNFVLLEMAEAGVLAGILAAALLVALAVRAVRRDATTAAVFASLVFFYLLDAYPFVFPTGLAISALWLGLQQIAGEERPAVA